MRGKTYCCACGSIPAHRLALPLSTVLSLVANFDYAPKPANVLIGNTVYFTDTSTTDGPPIVGWYWGLGDGGMSTTRHPTRTYKAVGTFTVSLLITDSMGYTSTKAVANALTVAPLQIYLPVVMRH